jgi:thiamine biosynthesis lipoprotein
MKTPRTTNSFGIAAVPRPLIILLMILPAIRLSSISASEAPEVQTAPLARFTYTQYHMGIQARLIVYAPDQKTAEDACTAAFARIAALDAIMSDYRQDSELNRLCNKAGGPPVYISPDLFFVLQRAQEVAELTEGAFDVTAAPLIQLWRASRSAGVLPEPKAIEEAKRLVGWRKLILDSRPRTASERGRRGRRSGPGVHQSLHIHFGGHRTVRGH